MNYRKLLLSAVVVFGVLTASLFIISFIRFPRCNRPTVLFPNVSFGMPQRKVKNIFGNPTEVTKDSHNSHDCTYLYELEVAGNEAKVYFTFKEVALRNQLYRVSIDFDETTDAEEFAQILADMINAEYAQAEGYYIKSDSINYTNIGVQNGAVGINFTVNISQAAVSVHAVCDEYDG